MAKTNQIDMLNGGILRKIIVFALPLIASGVLQQSFNSVDVAVVGKYASHQALAAVGSNGMVISIMINLFVGISVGANVIIANYIGQNNKTGIKNAIQTVALVALISGIALLFIGSILARPILEFMDTPDDVIDLATLYLRIYFLGMPFMMIFNFGSAILRSFGDTKSPFYALIAAGIVNIGLNLLLVIGFGMTVDGVAIATVISNIISSGIILRLLLKKNTPYHIDIKKLGITTPELSKMMKIGIPAGLQGMVFSFANIFIQGAINSFGSDAIAGSAAALNYEYYCYFIINAIGQAAVAFISQNYGAGKIDRCRKVYRYCMILSIIGCGIPNLLIAWQNHFFLSFFTNSETVIAYGTIRLHYVLLLQFIASSYEISSAAMRGYGYSMTPTILTIFGTCVLRLAWIYFALPFDRTLEMLYTVYPLSWLLTGIMVLAAYYKIFNKIAHESKAATEAD